MGIVATGGTITQDGKFRIHTFTANGTFEVIENKDNDTVEYLVIGGGGAGGSGAGTGGGGGGGHQTASGHLVIVQSYPITVGTGGAGVGDNNDGSDGNSSVF